MSIDNDEKFRALLGAYSETVGGGYVHTEADEDRFIDARRALIGYINEQLSWAKREASTEPSAEVDERYEFERVMSQRGDATEYIGDGMYSTGAVQDQWEVWLASAELAARRAGALTDDAKDAALRQTGERIIGALEAMIPAVRGEETAKFLRDLVAEWRGTGGVK